MSKKQSHLVEGQVVVNAKAGDRHGAIGVIKEVGTSSFRVCWKLSPHGVPYPEDKTSRFALTALAPKLLDMLDPVPEPRS